MPTRSATPGGPGRCSAGMAAGGLLAGLVLLWPSVVLPAAAEGTGAGEGEVFDTTSCQELDNQGAAPPRSWARERLAPERAWDLATGRGVTVAVVDTGVQAQDNPAFAGTTVSATNFAPYDQQLGSAGKRDCQHGTQVTSLIAGADKLDQRTNFAGIAPEATVVAMRSLQRGPPIPVDGEPAEAAPFEPLDPTVAAVRAATEQDVDVINISQTTTTADPSYQEAIEDALAAGIVVVAAAGNRPSDPLTYPAAYPGVIAVGATTSDDRPAAFSHAHEGLDITVSAPGQDVLTVSPGLPGQVAWTTVDGTSFAAPQVSGVVALLLEREPDLTPAEVAERLRRTADPIPRALPDAQAGWGVVNPLHALTDAVGGPQPAPGPAASPTPAEDYRQRTPPDHTLRNVSLVLAAAAVVVVAVGAVLAASLPAGRRRRWRPSPDERPPD